MVHFSIFSRWMECLIFSKTTSKWIKIMHEKCVMFTAKVAAKFALNTIPTTCRSLECWKGSNYNEKIQQHSAGHYYMYDLCCWLQFMSWCILYFLMSMGITSLTRTTRSYREEYRTLSISWLQNVHVRMLVVPSSESVIRRETTVDLNMDAKVPLT